MGQALRNSFLMIHDREIVKKSLEERKIPTLIYCSRTSKQYEPEPTSNVT